MFRGVAALVALLMGLSPVAARAQMDVGPFVAEDAFRDIKLSPTGEFYAVTVPIDGQIGLAIIRREDGTSMSSFRFERGTSVHDFWWVNDERVLMSVSENFGSRDDPLPTGELYAMNADGNKRELLVGWRVWTQQLGSKIRTGKKQERVAAFLIDALPDDDRNVLISVQPLATDPTTRVERMDVYTGRRTRVTQAPVPQARFVTDHAGVVRFAIGSGSNNITRTYYRSATNAEWELINDEAASDRIESPLGFSEDDATAYLRVQQAEGPDTLVAFDVATGKRRELLRDEVVDPLPLYRDGSGPMVGVRYLGARPRTVFLDEASDDARVLRSLEAAFPGNMVEVVSATSDGRIKLLLVSSDADPGSFYTYDAVAKKADFVLARREGINPEHMSPMRPVSLQARDGRTLHGFLTAPAGGGKRLPLVVVPHGGPFGVFDRWGFDIDAQLLAQAGYAVLQVNFRGSGNYGRAFHHAGARQWGGTMQDDVIDATRWAIGEGIADADRVCIYGASYGGYAALMGVAKEPDLYRCAVGYVGVYDLPKLRGENRRQGRWARTWTGEWMGDEPERLAAMSPNRLAGQVKVPVFLAAGGEDQIAPIAHSELMERALKNTGVPVETLYYPNEGHGFYTEEHRREFYVKLLDFLGRHLGGGSVAGR
ncbi:alpha/beta hydrolase family protein [Luteimonas salinilitoris]|uniref:Alpha/beta hydrolase family protein n=1 Tax=Luteimonas salinilitoris TaxID=3237697 RepID=A0ABV4HLF4_9GAMM